MGATLSAADFYDRLSGAYHLLYPDWAQAIGAQAAILQKAIQGVHGAGGHEILDCACGIGTQAIGLATLGHRVTGTDVSPRSIRRALREARSRGLDSARFEVADMRNLPKRFQDVFDVVIGCDDPLAHLIGSGELRIVFLGMRTALRARGLLLLSSRDYDKLLVERPSELPQRGEGASQLVEWDAGALTYVLTQIIRRQRRAVHQPTLQVSTKMRAYTKKEISEELEAAGFVEIRWINPEESGFYQPIVTAISPS